MKQTDDMFKEYALSASGFTNDCNGFAVSNRKTHTAQDGLVAEGFMQVAYFYHVLENYRPKNIIHDENH